VIDLPIGISFFTFQAVSYLVDSYQRRITPTPSLRDFAMYHSLFPQLVAGPIVRFAEVQDRITARPLREAEICSGLFRFCAGLGKKMILADPAGAVADRIFALPIGELAPETAWLGALAYTLQIFYDFSGYSDMAIGLGRMLGFRFPENFDQPYRSRSITEFWRRWHMTLSRWFRDYVYVPLGGNRHAGGRTYANLFTVFVLCGLWHGAGYTFLAWGLYHGALLCLERVAGKRAGLSRHAVLANLLTLLLVVIGWVIFRASSLDQAVHFLGRMFLLTQPDWVYFGISYYLRPDTLFYLTVGAILALTPTSMLSLPPIASARGLACRSALSLAVLGYSVLLLAANSFNPFIYFRF
jgi:alginate O-acetyltransferase complex protein AlgI